MLDGPMIRNPLRRDRATSAAMSMSVPSTEVTMTAPRIRFAMQASMVSSSAGAGTAMIASETSSGSPSIDRRQGRPCRVSWRGFTA